tara:strand:+ start:58 stop:504 length:447 start_codon:yes stop_codon:yes gene_type:complete
MSLINSDKGIFGDYTASKIVSRRTQWSDLVLALTLHPIRKDIIPLRDDRAVKNAVKNLLLTNFHERPFQASLGANLRGLLFEPADGITRIAIKDNVFRVLTQYEPRVKVINISVENTSDENGYNITVNFLIKEYDSQDSVEIVLRRLR